MLCVDCANCNKCYIGQTRYNLETTLNQHKNNIKNGLCKTGLSEHTIKNPHNFDFDEVTVLEKNVHKKVERETLEKFHIKKFDNNLNLQRESGNLSNIYASII